MKKYVKLFVGSLLLFMGSNAYELHAESFEGRESEMNEKCSAIYNEEVRTECSLYKEYLQEKKQQADQGVSEIEQQLVAVKDDIEKTVALLSQNEKELVQFEAEILQLQDSIGKMEASIQRLEGSISEKKESIEERDQFLKHRMVVTQPEISSNSMIDFLMGSEDFTDLLRRMAIVRELQSYEQSEIETLAKEKAELTQQQEDQALQQELMKVALDDQESKKQQVENLKSANEVLLTSYREKEAGLQEQKVKEQLASGAYASAIPNIDLTILPPSWGNNGPTQDPSEEGPTLSTGFIRPIQGSYYVSAGTWYYPLEFTNGILQEHLGMDFGTYQQVGLNVVAPASGVVVALYDGVANHPIGTNGINSWTGYPSGGGNTLHMITKVNGVCYGISFYHLSPGMFNVRVGSVVDQGQVIAHTGHSGNTSGPHCHVEFTNLGAISIEEGVQMFYRYGKDYFYGNYNVNGRCEVKGTTPCLERPENFIG